MHELNIPARSSEESTASKVFVAVLYTVAGIYLAFNVLLLLAGSIVALLPITIQLSVLIFVYRRADWIWKLVLAWGVFMMIAGGAHWLTRLLDPMPVDFLSFNNIRLSASLVLGIYFIAYAREHLSARAAMRKQ